MGLPVYESIGTSQAKTYTWIKSTYISNDREWLYDAYDTQIFVPLLSSTVISRDGVNYTTTNSNFTNYGNPQNINETGQSTRTTALTYWSSGTYYVVDKPATKTVTVNGQSFGISYTYNSQGSVLTENKYGVTTTFTYYTNGDIDRVTDASGSWIDYSSYAYGLPQTIQNPIYSITRTINWEGTVATETNGRGKTTSYLYDNANRLTRITPPLGDYTAITYASNCTWEKSARGSYWSQKNYDGLGRSSGTTNVVGVNTSISYNNMGLKSYESYPHTSTNIGRSFEYDNLGRINKITNPDATTINYTFSGANTTVNDERSKNVTYTYQAFGDPDERWLMQVADAIATTSYTRNTLGSVTQITKGSLIRTYNYNTTTNFLVSETTPEAGTVNYAYNAIGLVTQRADAERTINYDYDDINRLTSIDYPSDSADVAIGYDNANNRTSLSSLVVSYSFVYDNADRMTSKVMNIESRTYNLTFGYDTRDNLTSIIYPDNISVSYTYDNGNRTTAISGYITGVTYHPSSGEATISYANGKTATISYNNRYRISGISVSGAIGYSYLYDGVGNMTTLTDNINSAYNQSYAYDDVNRMITANGPWAGNSYSYDIHGNITAKTVEYSSTYAYNYSTNRLTTADSWGYTYNGAGEVTGVSDGGWAWLTMTYDPAGRLKYFLDGNFGYPANYWYDGDGVRVKQYQKNGLPRNYSPGIVTALVPQTPPYVRYYVCNGNNTLAEYDEYNALKCKYIYLNGKLAVKVEGTSAYYYHCDYLGTPKAITNSSGTVVRTDNYYPFGKQYNYTGTYSNNRKFTSKERDWSGLDYFGARYYDCRIGRFLVPDPDLFGAPKEGSLSNPQRLNRYSYCLNNPYRFIDPNGEAPYDWADAIDGFLSRTIFSEASKATASITMTPATAYVTESVIRGSYDFLRFGVGTYNAINGNNTLWETVGYVGQDVLRAAQVVAYVSIAAKGAGIIGNEVASSPKQIPQLSTGRNVAKNAVEQAAMDKVMANPLEGAKLRIQMKDPIWHASEGWVKMARNIDGVEIHWLRNTRTNTVADFKFK
ncbi:MAG: hypothetical protein A2502_09665 [Candidatus Edwardsbacteria bacterium RifOxyC12_full_54_24]|nr:MAG: hypothetical protein A2502_09665 [Candidatus Edwardsbacteria bacterium RifOxyC12_full_54_24]